MKISLNWVKEYTRVDLSVDELVKKIGAQLGAVEEVIDLGKKYQGIVIAKVITCEKHPNADKLSVCTIDDGGITPNVKRDENGHVEVVCGAPNVAAGQTVAWLPPGTTVPSTHDKEPFVLEARELRGVISNGMIASAHELAISDDHNGIVVLNDELKPGSSFVEAFKLNDYIIDIENKMFTHRPDLFGQLGVAREIAGITHQQFKSPNWYVNVLQNVLNQDGQIIPLEVKNTLPELVSRFMAVAVSNIEVKPSPIWLQSYLSRVGIRPINNVVDITNYIMMETAQPLHAYDADKLRQVASSKDQVAKLETRKSRKGEKLRLLGGKEIEFEDDSTIVITSGDVPVGIGGVMGGADTEVDENSKNIVLECANFDMYSIRRTAMRYGLFTDAVTRFNKGQSPLQNDRVLAKTVSMLCELAGGKIASTVQDVNNGLPSPKSVAVDAQFINSRLGLNLDGNEMASLLRNVEFEVEIRNTTAGAGLDVIAPFWRTDIEIPEDIVEEIGRLYGYDHLPVVLPVRSITPPKRDELLDLKAKIRDVLSTAGANEVLTYNFVHGDLMSKVGQDRSHAFELSNALSPDLQYFRTGLTSSLLDKVHPNIKAGFDKLAIFELNKVHYKDEWEPDEPDIPLEDNHLALVVAYDVKSQPSGAPYYHARKYLDQVARGFVNSLVPLEKFDLSKDEWGRQLTAPYEPKRSAVIVKDDQIWGVVGEFKSSVRRALKLPAYIAGLEINLGVAAVYKPKYRPLSRFPKVEQDITLKVPSEVAHGEVATLLESELVTRKNLVYELVPLDIYQSEKDPGHKNLTFRLIIASYEKTMVAPEVNGLLDEMAGLAKDKLGAERI
ncbi:phenylalanine--tRNA ligase subunit beta [Candidatus Saccharibacteria bacterium]|nr:phenylalanine--tRNA ligase subunit beta [Candidatus Saccharibacteria bacterium]MBI3338066.1 phenylalanine--tRNA ligase subunit beta [Candidatus Saccharibacteria bacterium]